jgi:hypothetical protein
MRNASPHTSDAPLVTFGGGHLWQVGRDARLTHLATLIKDLAIVPRA